MKLLKYNLADKTWDQLQLLAIHAGGGRKHNTVKTRIKESEL